MSECTVCGAAVTMDDGTMVGELLDCGDCGSELEVTGLSPFSLQDAPQEAEDWGQ